MKNRPLVAILLALLVLPSRASSAAVPRLSAAQRTERIRALPEEERRWLEDLVRPIILPDEENLFLLLTQEHERDDFKREFWERREKVGLLPPLGPGYRLRYQELLHLADTAYDGRRQDAGRMVIAHGEPASIDELNACKDMFRDLQIWTYRGTIGGNTGELRYFFYRRSPGSPRKLWDLSLSDSDIFQPGSCRRHLADLFPECTGRRTPASDPCYYVTNCPQVCQIFRVYQEIKAREGSGLGGRVESASVLAPPGVELEGLEALAARSTGIANPQARPISIQNAAPTTVTPARFPTPSPFASLTPEEIRERILGLAPKYREFVELAGPMFVGDELSRFLQMSDAQKDSFMGEFFRRQSR